jgi:hypothetical protein
VPEENVSAFFCFFFIKTQSVTCNSQKISTIITTITKQEEKEEQKRDLMIARARAEAQARFSDGCNTKK